MDLDLDLDPYLDRIFSILKSSGKSFFLAHERGTHFREDGERCGIRSRY